MLIKDLIKFANDLDRKGLKKEADAVDVIINAVKTLLEERGHMEASPGEKPKDPAGDKEESSKKEGGQVEAFGYKTQNFDICPGAVEAFSEIKEKVDEDSNGAEYALSAMKKTDDLFQIEKNAINSESVTSKEVDSATDLYEEIIYNIGMLSADIGSSLLGSFDFLSGHIDKIKSFKKNGENNEE